MNTIKDNPFCYSKDNKRYHTYNYYLRRRFGTKVFKVSLNLGLTCPNRDGSKGSGGCIFCSDKLSGEFGGDPKESIRDQFDAIKAKMESKWHGGKCIAYFQAGTNTYADIAFLERAFNAALSLPGIVGISIATRADCLDEQKADMLARLSEKTYLVVELGLQTIHNETAAIINRCHTYEEFLAGYKLLSDRGINVCVHLINGLPGESREMMIESARQVGLLRPHAVKIHLLHILKNTPLADMYEAGLVTPMSQEEYVSTICDQLETLPPETVIERVTGDGAKASLVAPLWSLKKFCVMNEIDKEMGRRESFQGMHSMPPSE